MNKHLQYFFSFLSFSLFLVVFAAAQEASSEKSRNISGGVLNSKATQLVKPEYPGTARAVNASGSVHVQVIIDEEGNVVSATAISGHPLLRAAAANAARISKFSPTLLAGNPVKVTGIIVYNFGSATPLDTLQMGLYLGEAENSAELTERFPAYKIASSINQDWNEEQKLAEKLIQKLNFTIDEKFNQESQQGNKAGKGVLFVGGNSTEDDLKDLDKPHTVFVENLVNSLKKRYANDEMQNWLFKVGLAFGKIKVQLNNDAGLKHSLHELKQLVIIAPENVHESVLFDELNQLVAISDQTEITLENKAKIEMFIKQVGQ